MTNLLLLTIGGYSATGRCSDLVEPVLVPITLLIPGA